jgi:hypothetical protein
MDGDILLSTVADSAAFQNLIAFERERDGDPTSDLSTGDKMGSIVWRQGAAHDDYASIRGEKDAAMKEIQIDLPLALKSTLAAATWPIAAFGELTSGKLLESDDKVTVSPR